MGRRVFLCCDGLLFPSETLLVNAPPRTLDWLGVKGQLRTIHETAPQILVEAVLIGGAACLAYRALLDATENPDFRSPIFSPAEEVILLSKDIDFANLDASVADLVKSVPIGRLQFGVPLGSDDFRDGSRPLQLSYEDGLVFSISIADPLDLYREKDAAAVKLGRPQDRLHRAILAEFVKWELASLAAQAESDPIRLADYGKLRSRCRDYAPELFQDPSLLRRLAANSGLATGFGKV